MDSFSVDSQTLDELRASTTPETRLRNGSTARRVGRNPVWRLTNAGGQPCFVKLCRDGDDFARQAFGLRIASAMAAADARFMAADVVEADPARRLLVTRPIGGVMVGALFARGFRRDRNPFGRAPARVEARTALALVRTWLDALQATPADPAVPLYDHSSGAVWQRTARKLEALAAIDPSLSAYAGFARQWRFVAAGGDESLVFGDATLANFFVDEGRIGAVDFEDIGRGPVARDRVTLQDDVVRAFRQFHYRRDRDALDRVSCVPGAAGTLVLLELAINRLEHALQRRGLSGAMGRRSSRARVARLVGALAAAGGLQRLAS